MKICFISHSSDMGGAERVLLEMIDILRESGIHCNVILPARGPLFDALSKRGVGLRVVSYPLWMGRRRFSWFDRFKIALSISINSLIVACAILRWRSDLVYTNTVTVCVGGLASCLTGRPHIWHLHEFGTEDQGLSYAFGERVSHRLIDRLSSRCICVSRALAHAYGKSIDSSKIDIVYPAMHNARGSTTNADCENIAVPARNGNFRCVIVGALIEGKGQVDAVLAIAELRKLGAPVELLIVGDGVPNYRRRLFELIQATRLEELVTLTGPTKCPNLAVQGSDVVLVCSKSEAFGRVTIEGMLAGKPVIAANTGANPELIQDKINGLLYRAGDAMDLADKILLLQKDPELAKNLGEAARLWAEDTFSKDRFSGMIIPLLTSVVH